MKLTPKMVALIHEVSALLATANAETDYTENELAAFGNAGADLTDEIWYFVDNGGTDDEDSDE